MRPLTYRRHQLQVLASLLLLPTLMQAADTIRHTIRFPNAETHYAEVEVVVPTESEASIDLMMAVWTPGSYLVRDYSGKVESEQATTLDGRALPFRKSAKNRWTVETTGQDSVRFTYKLYCREMSVRSNWVEADFAIIIGAATFFTVAEEEGGFIDAAHEVTLELPSAWSDSHSSLPRTDATYRATDFHELLDTPIVAGNLAEYAFDVDGVPHTLVNLGEGGVWDGPKSAADVETITRAEIDFWGVTPYTNYSYLNAITESRGGLEHRTSTLVMASRYATETREAYLGWLYLMSHEFFHTWNVKRLRPVELDDFDYERETYTTGLWVAEGLTSYYDPLIVLKAGLSTRDEYLKELSREINNLESRPGRLTQSLTESSYDAWVKFYRPSENTANAVVSYYGKGALVGWLLDVEIRKLTNDDKSLDDVMRLAYERYSGDTGYTQQQFRDVVSEIAGSDLSEWIAERVDQPGELSYDTALDWFGLRFAPPKEDEHPTAWLGITTNQLNGRLTAATVIRDSPAHKAGLNPGDEVLAINGYRIPASGLADRLKAFSPGDELAVLVSRRERILNLTVDAGTAPTETRWNLEVDPEATTEQTNHVNSWLATELESTTDAD